MKFSLLNFIQLTPKEIEIQRPPIFYVIKNLTNNKDENNYDLVRKFPKIQDETRTLDQITEFSDPLCRTPPAMQYTTAAAVLVIVIVLGGAFLWVKFLQGLSNSEDSSTPFFWLIFCIIMILGSLVLLIVSAGLKNWTQIIPGATFSPFKVCPDDFPCYSTIHYGCPVSTAGGGQALDTTRVCCVLDILSLSAATIFLGLSLWNKFYSKATFFLALVQIFSLIGAITSLITWGIWAAYSVDVIATLPGSLNLGEGIGLHLIGFAAALSGAYMSAYARKAVVNRQARDAARLANRQHEKKRSERTISIYKSSTKFNRCNFQ